MQILLIIKGKTLNSFSKINIKETEIRHRTWQNHANVITLAPVKNILLFNQKIMDKKEMLRKRGLAAACVVALLCLFWVYRAFFSATFDIQDTAYIYIDEDDTADSVRVKIRDCAAPGTTSGFSTLAALSGYKVRTGCYAIEPDENMLRLFLDLKRGRQTPVRLTIPNVRTMDRLAGALGHRLMLDSTELARHFADSAFCRRYGYDTTTLACLFIPNTYEVYWNIGLEDFMQRMQKENKAFWTEERLAKAQKAGMTPEEVVTLASIVDEETANNAEKPMVAGMYINRLHTGMPLQADPTIKFALRDFSLRRIYHNMLDTDSPYNTYRNTGLPPGPIRIPSIAGIDAVLNHVEHDYLYMCAKEDFSGTHNFARTYREHLANAAKYSAALNKRGIR